MSDEKPADEKPKIGSIGWLDLTVTNAETVRDFYAKVVGWDVTTCPVDDYEDFVMQLSDGTPVAGVCHSSGPNAEMPSGWIPYFVVESLKESMKSALAAGGEQVGEQRKAGGSGAFCFVRDPGGAISGLYESS